MLYSKQTNSFFCPEYNLNIPEDAKEIPQELYHDLLMGASEGKNISYDGVGNPILVERSESLADKISSEKVWRDSELIRSDVELNKVQDAHPRAKGTVGAWRVYRNALRDLPDVEGFPNKDVRPSAPDLI